MIRAIADRLTVWDVLDAAGIDTNGRRRRIPCPVHGGRKPNFAILDNGNGWKCFSRDCGAGRKRDSVNLYCILRHGAPLPDLPDGVKGEALRDLAALAHIDPADFHRPGPPRPRNRFEMIPEMERKALMRIFADTRRLDTLGKSRLFTSPVVQRIILFLGCAKSESALPERIDEQWNWFEKMESFANAR